MGKMSRKITGAGSLFLLLILVFFFSCTGQNGRNEVLTESKADVWEVSHLQSDISFDSLSHDFGTIIEGEMVLHYFEYENTGEGDLVIAGVETTCGCTTLDWNREPLKPGGRSQLKVVFDTKGRLGAQLKPMAVKTNGKTPVVWLSIKANVTNNK